MGLLLGLQQFVRAVLHVRQGTHVFLVEIREVALVLVEQVLQRFESVGQLRIPLFDHLLLRSAKLLNGAGEHAVREVLEEHAQLLAVQLMLLAFTLKRLVGAHQLRVAHREVLEGAGLLLAKPSRARSAKRDYD